MAMLLRALDNEASIKRFSRRLHDLLLARGLPEVPTLAQMQEIVMQGLGHQDRHAAQQFFHRQGETKAPASETHRHGQPGLSPSAKARLSQTLAELRFPGSDEIPTGWRVFRFAAIQPSDHPEVAVTVHVAWVENLWRDKGLGEHQVNEKVQEALAMAGLNGLKVEVKRHDWRQWPIGWADTILDSMNAFPTLVVVPQADGRLRGVVMADTMLGDAEAQIKKARSSVRAQALVEELRGLAPFADHHGWFKQTNFEAEHLADLVATAPRSKPGQFSVWLFEDDHWKHGLYHSEDGASIRLHAKTKPASHKPLKPAELLDKVRANQTVVGDWGVLDKALLNLAYNERHFDDFETEDFEDREALQQVCAWWNTHAPEPSRHAGCFRLFAWDPRNRLFKVLGPGGEPALDEDNLKSLSASSDYALFERSGRPTLLAFFMRGRAHNRLVDGSTHVYQANGDLFWDVGCDLKHVNEAHVAVLGLAELQDGRNQQWKGWKLSP